MPRSWQEDFFERLVAAARPAGDPRMGTATAHPRKKTASFEHAQVRFIECAFDTNRLNLNPDSQVFVIECAPRRGTEIDGPALEREFTKAGLGGDVAINGGIVLMQYRWGYGRDEPFPVRDPRRVKEVSDWALAALRILFDHLERHRNVIVPAGGAAGDTGGSPDYALALEKYLEDLLVERWDVLDWGAPLEYIGRQVPAGDLGFIDILARDRDTGTFVVIELKRDRTDDEVVGQLSRYLGWIKENRAAPAGVNVRGIIVVHDVTPRLRSAVVAHENVQIHTYSVALTVRRVSQH